VRRVLILLNPVAGAKKLRWSPERLQEYFKHERDIELVIKYTEYKGHGTEIINDYLDKGLTDCVAVGGDGSLRDVVTPLIHQKINVGILPTGSGNGIARHLNIPVHSSKALDIIKEGRSIPLDAGSYGDHYFFSNAGIGLDAWIIKKYDSIPQRGWFTYSRLGVSQYFQFKPPEVQVQLADQTYKKRLAICSIALSNQYGYNVKIAPGASLFDGLFDVQLIPMLNVFRSLDFTAHMLSGKPYRPRDVIYHQTDIVDLDMEAGLPMQLDGEPFTTAAHMQFKILPAAWNALVPEQVYDAYTIKNSQAFQK